MNRPETENGGRVVLFERLAGAFYEVVPVQYRTYCSFTSQIMQRVLQHFGVRCERVSCQVWYTKPDHIYVIGFLGKQNPGKWDGHVVCCADGILIDAATHHFEREFGLGVPWIVMTQMFAFPTTAIAHRALNATDALWWHPPPEGVDVSPPEEPQELVEQYADGLIRRLSSSRDG